MTLIVLERSVTEMKLVKFEGSKSNSYKFFKMGKEHVTENGKI